ncbi:MAG: AAA family ATPase [Bacteroidota bacterium]
MKTGLVLGKFMPIHKGHLELIRFGQAHCDRLIVLVCATSREPIPGPRRLGWVQEVLAGQAGIEVHYTDVELPEANYSSRTVSQAWAAYLSEHFPEMSVIFTSEKYGDYVAEYMNISHQLFDQPRLRMPVSATDIRNQPFRYWDFIPEPVRPYFVKKICLYGPESTGKSTLAAQMAAYFGTTFVPEAARDILTTSLECTLEDIMTIARTQAAWIQTHLLSAHKLLFCDTDLLTTRVYSQYMFNRVPDFEPWIIAANQYDLYLFLDTDVPYVQDGTRLGETTRPGLRDAFLMELQNSQASYTIITGNWEQRFEEAVRVVEEKVSEW